MARKPMPGSDDGQWGSILNEFLDVAHTTTGELRDDSVTEQQLTAAVRTKLNVVGSPDVPAGTITTLKLADGAVTDSKVSTGIAQSKITNLTSDLASKASTSHTHTLDSLSDVSVAGATDGQALILQGSQWGAATITTGGGGVTDHGALTGLSDDDHPQYHNDSRGDARYYTKAQSDTALGGKANTVHTHTISDVTSLQTSLDSKAATAHTHNASDITAGTVASARLGTGTASSSTYLRGDGTWATPATGDGTPADGTVTDAKVAAGANISQSKIANLTTDLSGKANSVHTHAIADVTNLQTTLDGKASTTHTHTISDVTNLQTSLDAKANANATVNLTGDQTVAGIKTFTSFPVLPTGMPSTGTQVASKDYVDVTVSSITPVDIGAVQTSSAGMQLDYGTSLPTAGTAGRFFIVIPE